MFNFEWDSKGSVKMPKATKKQKEKVADFSVSTTRRPSEVITALPCRQTDTSRLDLEQKAKLKLGKGKQIANNATDTSYKARCKPLRPSCDGRRIVTLIKSSFTFL